MEDYPAVILAHDTRAGAIYTIQGSIWHLCKCFEKNYIISWHSIILLLAGLTNLIASLSMFKYAFFCKETCKDLNVIWLEQDFTTTVCDDFIFRIKVLFIFMLDWRC